MSTSAQLKRADTAETRPLVSVVMPCFNVASTLSCAYKSLCAQSYEHFEALCVDDGSRDNTWEVLQDLAARDSRMRVFHQENRGPSAARNHALAQARGEIIMFLDADDEFVPEAIERVVSVFLHTNCEVFSFGFDACPLEFAPQTMIDLATPSDSEFYGFSSQLMFHEAARPFGVRTSLSHAFVEREHIHFDESCGLGEDQVFFFSIYPRSKKTVLKPWHLYRYNLRDASFAHGLHKESARASKISSHIKVLQAIVADWKGSSWFCEAQDELFSWMCDFLLFDLAQADVSIQKHACEVLVDLVRTSFPDGFSPKGILERRLFLKIQTVASSQSLRGLRYTDLVFFYLARRGLRACILRVLHKLLGKSSYAA